VNTTQKVLTFARCTFAEVPPERIKKNGVIIIAKETHDKDAARDAADAAK
jgi:hypothetical protein